jgi:hypothetical protein
VSTHFPLQFVICTPLIAFTLQPHLPPVQNWLFGQAVPQEPQLDSSVCRSAHLLLHVTYPGLQAQVPFRQVLPISLQIAPQEPQLKLSSCRSAQEKLQFVCPGRQPLMALSFETERLPFW